MPNLWTVPIASVVSLSPEGAVTICRAIFRSEYTYAKLGPSSLTISDRLMTPDGGIDAEMDVPTEHKTPTDCLFKSGVTGYQIKSGTTFKPWTLSAIKSELLNSKGELCPEVNRLIQRQGNYTLICTGHDLTPEQRNNAKSLIENILNEKGFDNSIDVLGASQIVEYVERYPGIASSLTIDPIQEAWTLEEWEQDAHMTNHFEEFDEQTKIISQIRSGLQGETKHIRILGEAGLGKTRIVLEAVKDKALSSHTLYIQHGSQFGQTGLFRQLIKSSHEKPLILVIDELSENELTDIWRHLKPRCGYLKIVSMDHGRDETRDEEIDRINAPYLPNDTIKKVLAHRIGESRDLDRWVDICEGSPRVAQAVADNLYANPSDLLKPPATIPIWERFLHGYGNRNQTDTRQIECVTQHLALFSRFGYEAPVSEEAFYIAGLIKEADPTIGSARFQEIIQDLRSRRVLQGSHTLFFVPKALHIYLWKKFWTSYGRSFDFTQIFIAMPNTLHTWFMNMFKYAGEVDTTHIIKDILKPDGIFSEDTTLTSKKGAKFLSVLAEANPLKVLKLLEETIGTWPDEKILNLKNHRQQFVWTLEKIAVWTPYTVRAMKLLIRFAVNENSDYSNNATGTLLGLFRIGPEFVATESSPEDRLPAFIQLIQSSNDAERRLGLKAAKIALDDRGLGYRMIGPEYQGLKERAELWIPKTYDDWWQAYSIYFQALVDETSTWPSMFRPEICETLFEIIKQQINVPPCTELTFEVLDVLVSDNAMSSDKLNNFFSNWNEYHSNEKNLDITKRLQIIRRKHTQNSLASRFQRYVIDVNYMEWNEEFREKYNKPKNRSKALVIALVKRIVSDIDNFNEIRHLLSPDKSSSALSFFGEQLYLHDKKNDLLSLLIEITVGKNHQTCLYGYLSGMKNHDYTLYASTINEFLNSKNTAWIGAIISLHSDYNDEFFIQCIEALKKEWIVPRHFSAFICGELMQNIPKGNATVLFNQLATYRSEGDLSLLIQLLNTAPFDDSSAFDAEYVFQALSQVILAEELRDTMSGYYWKEVCQKLITWNEGYILPLLDVLLSKMEDHYELTYHSDVVSVANKLVQEQPLGAWKVIARYFEITLPNGRVNLLHWLKGGLGGFNEESEGAITNLPFEEILAWIEVDPEQRAKLIADATPSTLNDTNGGQLTRELLKRYSHIDGVQNRISCNFHTGSWSGPRSKRYKFQRDKFRQWLGASFELEITRWIESEIEYLDHSIEREEISEERSHFD